MSRNCEFPDEQFRRSLRLFEVRRSDWYRRSPIGVANIRAPLTSFVSFAPPLSVTFTLHSVPSDVLALLI